MENRVTTSPSTKKTMGKSVDALASQGNAGNTKGTKLPKGGCPRGTKKSSGRKGGY